MEHIHANEVILTFSMSETTLLFLKEAGKKRDFQVEPSLSQPPFPQSKRHTLYGTMLRQASMSLCAKHLCGLQNDPLAGRRAVSLGSYSCLSCSGPGACMEEPHGRAQIQTRA